MAGAIEKLARRAARALARPTARPDQRRQRKPVYKTDDAGKRVGPFQVQGKHASDLEFTCYLTLIALGWTDQSIQFQVETIGGRNPGGRVLDFVVWAPGGPIVLEVNGDIWHVTTEAQRQDGRVRQAAIEAAWGGQLIYIVLGTGDLTPDAVAYSTLLKAVGRGG